MHVSEVLAYKHEVHRERHGKVPTLAVDARKSNWKGHSICEDVLPEVRSTSSVLCCAGESGTFRFLQPQELLACKGFPLETVHLNLCKDDFRKAADCVPRPVVMAMLLMAATTLAESAP